jgi:hypothetical protein
MLPIYWIMALVLIGVLVRSANTSNKRLAERRQHIKAAAQLTAENEHLRRALAQISMDVYSQKNVGQAANGR